MIKLIQCILLCICTLLFSGTSLAAEEAGLSSLSSAVNKAGRQRMLTQRMVKAYTMVGINVQKDVAAQQLAEAIELFEYQLHELFTFAPDELIHQSLKKIESLWKPIKNTLRLPVERDRVISLNESAEELLRASHKLVLQLEDRAGTTYDKLVNSAGRQRMLSQRMAKFYMMRSWQFGNAEIRSEMGRAKNEFKGALIDLLSATQNTAQLHHELEKAKREWELMEHGLDRNEVDLVPLIVSMTSERLLQRMDTITLLYEQLSTVQR